MPLDLLSLFFIALSASFGHCLGMCGGIVLAYTQCHLKGGIVSQLASHFIYGFGRITTYAFIGAISAAVGSGFMSDKATKGGLFIIVGFVMILWGIFLAFSPRILANIELNIANLGVFRRFFGALLRRQSLFSLYLLGVLNGAIPCGIVYFFALSASVSGGILNGAIVMIVFGSATLVPLVGLGVANSLLKLTRYRALINRLSAVLIAAFGAWTCFKGFRILFT